ncbi:MAG: hypothetical protein AAB481_03025 [Patescibacteria group bacterium]
MAESVYLYRGQGDERELLGTLGDEPLVIGKTVFTLRTHGYANYGVDFLSEPEHVVEFEVFNIRKPEGLTRWFKDVELKRVGGASVADCQTFRFALTNVIFEIDHGENPSYIELGSLY